MADAQLSPQPTPYAGVPKGSSMTAWLVRTGFAKDTKAAERLLMVVAGIGIVAAIILYSISGGADEYSRSEQQKIREGIQRGDIQYVP